MPYCIPQYRDFPQNWVPLINRTFTVVFSGSRKPKWRNIWGRTAQSTHSTSIRGNRSMRRMVGIWGKKVFFEVQIKGFLRSNFRSLLDTFHCNFLYFFALHSMYAVAAHAHWRLKDTNHFCRGPRVKGSMGPTGCEVTENYACVWCGIWEQCI